MPQSPEIDLLLLCARPQPGEDDVRRIRCVVQQKPDWPLLFHLAEYYRTIPLLALHLHRHAGDLLEADVRAELQERHRSSARHNLVLAAEVLRMIECLSSERIGAVPFKGPVSAVLAYGDMALRACGDIDLLVKQNDHGRVEGLLENEGYSVEKRFENGMQSSLWNEQRRISVDLHWGIPPAKLRLDSNLLWNDLKPVSLLGRSVLSFSPRDTLLVTATNVVKEYWKPSLHHLSDIVALTRDYDDTDWAAAFRRAREVGCQRMLVAAVVLAHRLLNLALPAAGPVRLFRHRAINRVVDEVQHHLFQPSDEQRAGVLAAPLHHQDLHSYYLALTDSSWRRSRDWLEWVITPGLADRAVVRLPKGLSFLYYLVRPLRLLVKHL